MMDRESAEKDFREFMAANLPEQEVTLILLEGALSIVEIVYGNPNSRMEEVTMLYLKCIHALAWVHDLTEAEIVFFASFGEYAFEIVRDVPVEGLSLDQQEWAAQLAWQRFFAERNTIVMND